MKLKPRFLFHANAAAIGGRIARPKDFPIDTPAASSLTAAGGRSTAKAEKGRIGEVIQYGSASTFAEGLFDDLGKWADTLCGDSSEDALTATTKVSSEVRNLVVNAKATFTAKRINGGFVAKSPKGSGQPSISLDRDTVFEGIALGGYKLIVELNTPLFQQFDTLAKLRTAADNRTFIKEHGASLFMQTAVPGRTTTSPAGRFVESSAGVIYGTIVKSLRWAGKPYPGAEIDDNVITIPDCGDIYFGEIYISDCRRRLTMLRMDLCCPAPMRLMMADTEDNGVVGGLTSGQRAKGRGHKWRGPTSSRPCCSSRYAAARSALSSAFNAHSTRPL